MKTAEELRAAWKSEESCARIKGWDFSHIDGRYEEEDALPWDYASIIRSFLRPEMKLLDYDTGGGEFLLSLNHPCENTSATEGYPPNVQLCKEKLLPDQVLRHRRLCVVRPHHRVGVPRFLRRPLL